MIRLYSTILVLFTVLSLSAQDAPSPIFVGSDAPAWMKMMLEPAPNVQQVATAYDVFYQTHPFEKNDYTQYYKR